MSFPTTTSETTTEALGVFHVEPKPYLRVVKDVPAWCIKQIEAAVEDFIAVSHLPKGIDRTGFYYQTLEAIAGSTYMGGAGDFWLGTIERDVIFYGIACVNKDIDQKLCYHISQVWIHQDYRGKPIVKDWWEQMRQRAKDLFCRHLVISSSRSPKAYIRFLGHGMHEYLTLLKEDF